MERKHIIIAGTNFAGYTAAIELKEMVGDHHDITVIAPTHSFLFFPSLIWYPFGLREAKDITFDVRPIYENHGIRFIEDEIVRFDLPGNRVELKSGEPLTYDYIVIGTGPKVDYDYIPGLREHGHSIIGLNVAQRTRERWEEFKKNPGPAVVASAQGAACFGAAYEFLFNLRYNIAKNHIEDRASLTYVTAEPFTAHLGIGGFGNAQKMAEWMFKRYDIDSRTNVAIEEITASHVKLSTGEEIPSVFTVVVPRFLGVDAVRNSPGLGNDKGFIEVDDAYQHPVYKNVYAAGVAVHVQPPEATPIPCGVPKTGYPTEQMAKTAVKNIVADIKGLPLKREKFEDMAAYCIMDTGNMGMMIAGDSLFQPREHQLIIPGPEAHWAKLAFEKYFLWTRRNARV